MSSALIQEDKGGLEELVRTQLICSKLVLLERTLIVLEQKEWEIKIGDKDLVDGLSLSSSIKYHYYYYYTVWDITKNRNKQGDNNSYCEGILSIFAKYWKQIEVLSKSF